MLKTFIQNEDGPTTVEYAILLAFIGSLLLATILSVGGATGTTFGANANAIQNALGH
ncbi:MAG: Flp family type IVb pilin [Mariniblastus sp.]|nr:Flp family type IVb pilin [Mariniblastus sp.]